MTTKQAIYKIHAFEGARGTSHRIRPICNIKVVSLGLGGSDTTYGWDGSEGVEIIDPQKPAAWHDVKDDVRSYHDIYVVLQNGDWYRQCVSGNNVRSPYWQKRGQWVESWNQYEWLDISLVPKLVLQVSKK